MSAEEPTMRRTLVLTLICAIGSVSTAAAQGLVYNGRPLREALSVKHTLKTLPPPEVKDAAPAVTREHTPARTSAPAPRQNGMSKKTKWIIGAAAIAGAIVAIVAATGGYSDDDPNNPYASRRDR
jgi:hypothetical protein